MSDSYSDTTEARPLVVDDDRVTRITISKVLNKAGYAVVETDGLEALQAVVPHYSSMVLMDVMMPEKGGYTACRELRKSHNHQDLPLLYANRFE